MSPTSHDLFGTVGEFRNAEAMIGAARELREEGFRRWDLFSPVPLEGIDELLPSRRGLYLTAGMVGAAVVGACLGYFIQWWTAVLDYPINVGGRPNNGWPGFVPSAWEICALFTVCGGLFGFLLSCRLPRLYHPIFAAADFERASQDRFFICVEAGDPQYDTERLRDLFGRHGVVRTSEVRL